MAAGHTGRLAKVLVHLTGLAGSCKQGTNTLYKHTINAGFFFKIYTVYDSVIVIKDLIPIEVKLFNTEMALFSDKSKFSDHIRCQGYTKSHHKTKLYSICGW